MLLNIIVKTDKIKIKIIILHSFLFENIRIKKRINDRKNERIAYFSFLSVKIAETINNIANPILRNFIIFIFIFNDFFISF